MSDAFVYDPFDPDFHATSHETYRTLRDEHPLYENPDRNFWAISRFEDVWQATIDHEELGTEGVEEGASLLPMLNYLDSPRHDRLRALVSRAFTFRRINEMEPHVRRIADELLDDLSTGDEAELVEAFATPLPGRIIAEMIGVPESRRGAFLEQSRRMLVTHPDVAIADAIREPSDRIYDEFRLLIDERRRAPQQDLMSALLEAEVEGERLSDDEILGFCFQLIMAGNDTTTALIGNGLVLLDHHPEQKALLVREPDRIADAVEEMLRFEPSAQALPRRTIKPYSLHGRTIPPDARVLLVWAAANLDEREFPDPERFDVTRRAPRHLALGHGIHFCLGASLARLEARVAFETLLERFPDYALAKQPDWLPSRWARAHPEIHVRL